MRHQRLYALAVLAAGLAMSLNGAALAQPAIPANIGAVPKDAPPPRPAALGPFAVTVETDPSLPTHTLYRPADLARFAGGKLPIVAFGEGGCMNAGRAFQGFLTEIASHGFMVLAVGPQDAPLPNFAAIKPGGPLPPMGTTHDSQLIDGIDWAIAQNGRTGGRFKDRLDVHAVAVMGQSCGGLQAIAVSGDPRIKTSVIWNSGVFAALPKGLPKMSDATKDSLKAFHAPVAYFIGGPTDVAYPNAEDDFQRIQGVPVFMGDLNVGHVGTYGQPNGGWFGEVGAAWLAWRLKGDQQAGKMFAGPACGLCTDPAWTIKKKNID